MTSNMQQEIWKVLTKIDRKQTMSSAALTSMTRSALGAMVERESRRVGSRIVAYHNVSQMVGLSPSWIRKFLSDRGEVKEPRITIFQNIRAAYSNLCERVEQENRADEVRLRSIRGELDAITEGFGTEGQAENKPVVGGSE